jgi:hypothetical protein
MFGRTLPKYSLVLFGLFSLADCMLDAFIIGILILASRAIPQTPIDFAAWVPLYTALMCAGIIAGDFVPAFELVDEELSPVTSRENSPLNLVRYGLRNIMKAAIAMWLVGLGYLMSYLPGCPIFVVLIFEVGFATFIRIVFVRDHLQDTAQQRYMDRLKDLAAA